MKIFPLTLLLLLPLLSIAQSNYKSGYVINLKGDTLHGYINFKEWSNNPESINFKQALTDKARQFDLQDMNYFEITGYVSYHAYNVSISTNTVDISSAQATVDTSAITGNVFLKILEKGKYLTLYSYKDNLKERFYIKGNDAAIPKELLYGIYLDPNKDNSVIDKNTFQVQLFQVAEKHNVSSDQFIAQVQSAAYKDYLLIPIVAHINGSANEETEAKSGNHNPSVRFYAGAAFISNTLKFSSEPANDAQGSIYYGDAKYTSGSPKISLGIDLFTNPDVGHLIFRMEAAYSTSSYTLTSQPNPLFNIFDPEVFSQVFKVNTLFLTPQMIYNVYNKSKLKIFFDVGYSFNLLSYPATQVVTSKDGMVLYTESTKGLDASSGNYSTVMLKAGAVVSKRFEIYAGYYLSAQIADSFDYTLSLISIQVGANYFIGKVAH